MRKRKTKKPFTKVIVALLVLMTLCISALFCLNAFVKGSVSHLILSTEEAALLKDVDCILVLGCKVKDSGEPSDMLHDRLTRGVELYHLGAAPKLLMSGDHGQEDYDEVTAMKLFALDSAVPSQDVFMDHAGFSTYESIYRAKEVFGVEKMIIVSQEYHLYRALYIAQELGVEAYGVSADLRNYTGQTARDIRELLARVKDIATSILQPQPTYLGETIPIQGNGDVTNDSKMK